MVKTWWKNLYRWYDAEAHDGGQNKVNLNSGFVQRWVGSDEESEVKIAGKTNIRSVFTNEATTFQDVPFAKLCLWNDQSCLWNEWTAYILLLPAVLAQAEMEWVNLLKCSFLQSYGIIKVVLMTRVIHQFKSYFFFNMQFYTSLNSASPCMLNVVVCCWRCRGQSRKKKADRLI